MPESDSDSLPDYADNGIGFPVFRAPYFQKNANLAAFLFNAEMTKLSALCDSVLNVSPQFAYKYIPLSASVMVVYADMLVSSRDERDALVGFIPEREVGFWALTLAMKKTNAGYIPSHLAWFLPYLFVNEGNSIASGREVFGFNKQLAQIQPPERIQKPEFSANVLGFKHFGAEMVAQNERLLHLRPYSADISPQQGDLNSIQNSMANDILKRIRADMDYALAGIASRLMNDHIPLVFLKQFRDAKNPRKACYQQIVEARLKVEKFYEGGIFFKPYLLHLPPLASHPLANQLGLKTEQGSKIGAWMKVDFVLGA